MRSLQRFFKRLAAPATRRRDEARLREEIDGHIALQAEEYVREGVPPAEARRRALVKFGGVETVKEDFRDQHGLALLEHFRQDIRYAFRQIRKNPGFASAAILMLALGMCASVAIFAFVDAALLKPLPYRDPAGLVGVYEKIPLCPRCNLSYFDYLDWKRLNTVFRSLDVYQNSGFTVSTTEGSQQAGGAMVTAGFFRTLGVVPILGRDFQPGEDQPSAPRTAILSYSSWQKRYGGSTSVLGRTVTLNGEPHVIVGVLPRDFHFAPAEEGDFWTALHATGGCLVRRSCHSLYGIARLKDGVSVEAALANATSIAQQLEKQYPDSNRGQGANVVALTEAIVGRIRPLLLVLLAGAGLLLLIAGVNIASLLLVRSESRKREIAVRTALGGSMRRLFSQFAAEGMVLAAAGSGLGIALAAWGMQVLIRLVPEPMMAGMPYLQGLGFTARVYGFAGAVSVLAALLFSLTPTLSFSRFPVREGLAEGSRGSSGTAWRRYGAKLVVVELATAVVLLVGAGLLSRSLYRLLEVDLGFAPENLATLRLGAPQNRYAKDEQVVTLQREVLRQVASLPGVESAAVTSRLPLQGGNTVWIRIVGRPYHGEHNEVSFREVSTGYFRTLEARLWKGRSFTEQEDASKPRVIVIDRSLAQKYFPGEDPIGKQISYASCDTPPMEIIGVVDNIKESAVDEESRPTMYVPYNQDPSNFVSLVVRTSQDPRSILPALMETIRRIDPDISTFAAMTMRQRIQDSPATYLRRSSAWLVGGFAAMALLLSAIGLYGVVAYSVSRRTREIGVRMALGAQRGAVYGLILKEAGRLAAAGILVGLALSMAAANMMDGLLFRVRPWDIPTLAVVAVVLAFCALLASYLPAHRAASVNPVEALRAE